MSGVIESSVREPSKVKPLTNVEQVFAAWQESTGHTRAVLDKKRRDLIRAALRDYSVEDLTAACRGITLSAFHMGQNERGERYDGLHIVLKGSEQIEKFRDLDRDGPRLPVSQNMATLRKVVGGSEGWNNP